MTSFERIQTAGSASAIGFDHIAWEATELGPSEHWPQALRLAVQLCLNAPLPMMLVWGPADVCIYNSGFLPLMGRRHPVAMGRPLHGAHPALAELVASALMAVRESGAPVHEDSQLLLLERDGRAEEAFFRLSVSPVTDEHGGIRGALCVADEVTVEALQLRHSQTLGWIGEELSRLSSRDQILPALQRVLECNPVDFARTAMFAVNRQDQASIVWGNPEGFGGSLPGTVSQHVQALPRQARQSQVARLGERIFALSVVENDLIPEHRYVLVIEPQMRVNVGSAYMSLLRMLLDSIVGATYRILLERRDMARMQTQLSDRDRLYRALFERSPDAIFICSPGGRILAANPAACEMLGYTEPEILAVGREGVVVDDDGSATAAMAVRRESGQVRGELVFRRKNGSHVRVDVSSALFEDQLTGDGRAVVFFRDAQQRLSAERRIAATARLEAMGALTAGVAHDFNNLLNVIVNGAEEIAERVGTTSSARESADLVLSACARAADLTFQLLAFSRQQPMRPKPVDLARVVAEMDQILDRIIGTGIDVEVEVGPGVSAMADAALLSSAVLNLCINARDAMPDGGTLTIRGRETEVDGDLAAELELQAGRYALMAVEDLGVGIPTEHLGQVFEPFFTTKPAGKGTGLGLSTVFGFMRQSNGSMRILSEEGAGTRVELYLPLAPEGDRAPEAEPRPTALPAVRTIRRVLLVEDDELLSTMLTGALEKAGYAVQCCADASSAVAALDGPDDFEVLVTDILLGPGPNGWTVARHAMSRRPDLLVVTMSGYAPMENQAEEGCGGVTLQKPFRMRELLSVIEAA